MRVLVIRPPIFYADLSLGLIPVGMYSIFLARYQPVGLMYMASLLREDGHEVALLDAEAEELETESVKLRVEPFAPDLILGSVNVYNSPQNFKDLIALKRHFGVPLVIRGHFPENYPERAMDWEEVDVALTGKGYTVVQALVRAIERSEPLDSVPGVIYRTNGEVRKNPTEPPVANADGLPFPARDLVDDSLYGTNLTYRRPCSVVFASFGCPFNCSYCTDHIYPYRRRSAGNVFAELVECVEKYGTREVTFLDPTFTVKRSWVHELCDMLIERRLDLTFTMRTRCDLLDREMIQKLTRARCVRISMGIESGDPEILKTLHRNPDLDVVRRTTAWIDEAGIMGFGYFMLGNKGESHESLRRTYAFMKSLPIHFAQFHQTIPLLNTDALESCEEEFGKDIWLEISKGNFPTAEQFRAQYTHLSMKEMRRWSRRFFRGYFLSPKRIWKLLTLKYTWAYVYRQFDLAWLVIRLVVLRKIRRRRPGFRLAVCIPEPRSMNSGTESRVKKAAPASPTRN